jgi:putative hemolysin
MGSVSASCNRSSAQLANQVEDAINLLVREKPQLFDLKDVAQSNTDLYKVLDTERYLDGVIDNLRRQGACAERDSDDPLFENILVKTSNGTSESYDVLLSSGYIRRTWSGYLQTCTPAAFPIDRNSADVPPAGSGCGRPYPPKVTRFNVKVHIKAPEYYTIDSTPMVGPDSAYCAAIGYTDGRSICRIRPEGGPYEDGPACENWRVARRGTRAATVRRGPTRRPASPARGSPATAWSTPTRSTRSSSITRAPSGPRTRTGPGAT